MIFIVQTFEATYQARDSVFQHPDEALRREMKIRREAEYFDERRGVSCRMLDVTSQTKRF